MNLPQLAKLLDDVRLCDVSFGDTVLMYLNTPLQPPHVFHADSTGNDLFETFDRLPVATRNLIRQLVLLTPDEVMVVTADVLCIRETQARIQTRSDNHALTISSYVVGVALAVAVGVVLQYVFDINARGGVISSLVWDWLLSVFRLYKGQ